MTCGHRLAPVLRHGAAIALVAVILAGVALWNRFPLVYFDSEDYVNMAYTWQVVIYRTLPYALVAWTAKAAGSLWAIVAVQALATAIVLHEAVFAFFPQHRWRWLFGLAVGLLLLTSLPWYVGMVLADVFAGVSILGMAVLAFGGLPRWRAAVLALVVALSLMVHMSHVAVGAGMVLALTGMWLISRVLPFVPRPALGGVVLAVTLGTAAVPTVHWVATGQAFFSPSGRVLQLALFVQHGLVERYLDDVCPKGKRLALCPYRDDLPETADSFLWAPWEFPFARKLGGWSGMMGEAEFIVADIVRRYPGEVLSHSLDAAVEQMVMIELGDGLEPKIKENWAGEFVSTLRARFPWELDAYLGSRQNSGDGLRFTFINGVQVPLSVLFLVVAVAMLPYALRRGDRKLAGLVVVIGLGLFGNAVVCGAISNPHDRYQNRLAWLPLVAAAAGLARPQPLRGRRPDSQSTSAAGAAASSQAKP